MLKQFPSETQLAQSSWLIPVMKVSHIIHPQTTNSAAAKSALELLGILTNPDQAHTSLRDNFLWHQGVTLVMRWECGHQNNFWMGSLWQGIWKSYPAADNPSGRCWSLRLEFSRNSMCQGKSVFPFWNSNTSFAELLQMGTPTEHGNCCFSGSIWLGKELVWEKEIFGSFSDPSCCMEQIPAAGNTRSLLPLLPSVSLNVHIHHHNPKGVKFALSGNKKKWFFFLTYFPDCHKCW